MTILHMETDAVRSTADQQNAGIEHIREQMQTVYNAVHNLDWQGPARDQFEAAFANLYFKLFNILDEGAGLAKGLHAEVSEWEATTRSLSGAEASETPSSKPDVPTPVPVPTPSPQPLSSYGPETPTSSPILEEVEQVIRSMAATKPIIEELILEKLKLGGIKDVIDLLNTEKHMEMMDQARDTWSDAIIEYGRDSQQAIEAREAYYDTYSNMPIIGPIIETALDMGRENPVY